jgi:hypothetical protein
LIEKGCPLLEGEVSGLPLLAPVEVLRDSWGIPHICARGPGHLMTGLGYVHARDLLWQMENLRLAAAPNRYERILPKLCTFSSRGPMAVRELKVNCIPSLRLVVPLGHPDAARLWLGP